MASSFDSNTWYNIFYGDPSNEIALTAFDINESGTGGMAGNAFDNSSTSFDWQILPIGPESTYVLRSRYLGNRYYAGAFWAPMSSLPGMDTRLATWPYASPDQAPTTAQWLLNPTNDGTGTEFLSTVANGTDWYLDNSPGGVVFLRDAAAAGSTNGMKWAVSSASAINNVNWSYTATATPTSSTSTSTSTPSSNAAATTTGSSTDTTAAQEQASSSSKPIGAIVGGVVGGVAVLLLFLGILIFFLRRRKRTRAADHFGQPVPQYVEGRRNELEGQPLFSERFGTVIKAAPQELDNPKQEKYPIPTTWNDAVELPTDTAYRRS